MITGKMILVSLMCLIPVGMVYWLIKHPKTGDGNGSGSDGGMMTMGGDSGDCGGDGGGGCD